MQLPGLQMLTPPSRTACPNRDREGRFLPFKMDRFQPLGLLLNLQQAMKLDSGLGQSQLQVENEGALVVASQAQEKADYAKRPTQVKDEGGKQGSQPAVGGEEKGGLAALSTLQQALQDREQENLVRKVQP